MKVVSFLWSFYRKKKLQLGTFNKIEKNVKISALWNRSLNFETFRQKLWICFLIFLSFPSCKRGSFDRIKESSFQYLCKNYLLFCDQIVAKIDMFDCDPLHNLYERDGTHYIDREVLADNLVVEKEEKETDVFDPYSEKNLKRKSERYQCRFREKYSNRFSQTHSYFRYGTRKKTVHGKRRRIHRRDSALLSDKTSIRSGVIC